MKVILSKSRQPGFTNGAIINRKLEVRSLMSDVRPPTSYLNSTTMFLEKLKHIKAFVLDVDGVMTNGMLLVTESGEFLRQFNIKDGYALQLAVKRGFKIAVVSGARSKGVEHRLRGLGINDIYLGLDSKTAAYNEFIEKNGLMPQQVLFMGDDIPDLELMRMAGLAVCPADAVEEIKAVAHYISPKNGGDSCVRDIIEKVLKIQNLWISADPSSADGSKI
jgi:3-deoxy-D-manno-octulosonate 8-phosphate phosphatase (KDO 8-P phosphatase)